MTQEKAITIECTDGKLFELNEYLTAGWKVKQMCSFNQSSALYARIVVILEKDEKDT